MREIDHLLSVGATGMLADAIVSLAGRSHRLTSIARTPASLERLAARLPAELPHRMVPLDYRDREFFLLNVRNAITPASPVDLAIVWMHGEERSNGVLDLAGLLGQSPGRTEFYHVVGSSGRDLATLRDGARGEFDAIGGISYHRIVLGFVEESGGRRWLSDREISEGTVRAIASRDALHIVGSIGAEHRQ